MGYAISQSGQYLFFDLVSAISGNPVTGASGAISGRKAIDGLSGMIVLSGNIIELGGGGYRANLYDWDVSGFNLGFLFTASGCVPRMFSVVTDVSGIGALFSGQSVLVYSGQLSGQPLTLLSGTTWLTSGHQAAIYSGNNVNVYSGQLSGQPITLLSGRSYTASGINAVATATIASGDVFLASGHAVFIYSGQLSGQQVNLLSGNQVQVWSGTQVNLFSGQLSGQRLSLQSGQLSGFTIDLTSGMSYTASGIFATATATVGSGTVFLASGHAAFVYSGQLSGQFVDLRSGTTFPASGVNTVASLVSGQQVQVWSGIQVNVFSGQVFLSSGQVTGLRSGQSVIVQSGQLSGQVVDLTSGMSYPASGINVVATTTVGSGTIWLASGHQAVLYSGQSTLIYSGQLSGQQVNLLSGNQVQVWSGTQVNVFSGQVYSASGIQIRSGVLLGSGAFEFINVEAGMNFRQSQAVVAAAAAGRLSGAGTATILFDGANVSGTNRITATVTASGNRTAVTLNLPA